MQGNLITMVQKNIQSLKYEVKNVVRKSNIDSLPSIHRNSANFKVYSPEPLPTKKNPRQNWSKQLYQDTPSFHGRKKTMSFKEEDQLSEYKIILMNPKKRKHPKRIVSKFQLSKTLEVRNEMESIEHLLTQKQPTLVDKKMGIQNNQEKKSVKKNQHYPRLVKSKKRSKIPKILNSIERQQPAEMKYSPWESSIDYDDEIGLQDHRY